MIGVGSFGEVYGVRSQSDNELYAVKRARTPFTGPNDRCPGIPPLSLSQILHSKQLLTCDPFKDAEVEGGLYFGSPEASSLFESHSGLGGERNFVYPDGVM